MDIIIHKKECFYEMVACPNERNHFMDFSLKACETMLRKNVASHIKLVCPFTSVKCTNGKELDGILCGKVMFRGAMHRHKAICPLALIYCPRKCG